MRAASVAVWSRHRVAPIVVRVGFVVMPASGVRQIVDVSTRIVFIVLLLRKTLPALLQRQFFFFKPYTFTFQSASFNTIGRQ